MGGSIGGVLGYAYQIGMGRLLSAEEYGVFTAIMALFVIVSAPSGALMQVVSRKVAQYAAQSDWGSVRQLYQTVLVRVLVIGLVSLAIYLFFSTQIQSYLKGATVWAVMMFGLLILINFPMVINNAFLQGLQRFHWLSASLNLTVIGKIVFCFALVWMGYGVAGAIAGNILAFLAIWTLGFSSLLPSLRKGNTKSFANDPISFASVLPVLLANLTFAVLSQSDMIVVNYFFSEKAAGLYAAASILGKAVMYVSGAVTIAVFPLAAENKTTTKHDLKLLKQAMLISAGLCLSGALTYYFLGTDIVRLLYGPSYADAGTVLQYYGFIMVPMALILLGENFLIAKGKIVFSYLFLLSAPIQIIALYFFHSTLLDVVLIVGLSGVIQLILGYWIAFRYLQKRSKGCLS